MENTSITNMTTSFSPIHLLDNPTTPDNFSSQQCRQAQSILTPTIKGLVMAEMSVAIPALFPNLLLISAIRDVTVFPLNLRVLMAHFSCVLIAFSLITVWKGIYLLTVDPCGYGMSVKWCKLFDISTSGVIMANVWYSLVWLCIERLIATFNYKHYDKKQRPWMAIVLIITGWMLAFLLNGGAQIASLSSDELVPFCDAAFLPPGISPYLFIMYMLIESSTTVISLLVHFYNRYTARNMAINRAKYDLSSRFLVDQNVQINQILLPSTALHFLCHIPAFVTLSLNNVMFSVQIDPSTRLWLLRSTLLWRLVYALLDPVIAFKYNGHLRQHLSNGWFGRVLRRMGMKIGRKNGTERMETNHVAQGAVHFDYLDKIWTSQKSIKLTPTPVVGNGLESVARSNNDGEQQKQAKWAAAAAGAAVRKPTARQERKVGVEESQRGVII